MTATEANDRYARIKRNGQLYPGVDAIRLTGAGLTGGHGVRIIDRRSARARPPNLVVGSTPGSIIMSDATAAFDFAWPAP